MPSDVPSENPSIQPSYLPSDLPSTHPSTSLLPSVGPSEFAPTVSLQCDFDETYTFIQSTNTGDKERTCEWINSVKQRTTIRRSRYCVNETRKKCKGTCDERCDE